MLVIPVLISASSTRFKILRSLYSYYLPLYLYPLAIDSIILLERPSSISKQEICCPTSSIAIVFI